MIYFPCYVLIAISNGYSQTGSKVKLGCCINLFYHFFR